MDPILVASAVELFTPSWRPVSTWRPFVDQALGHDGSACLELFVHRRGFLAVLGIVGTVVLDETATSAKGNPGTALGILLVYSSGTPMLQV